MIVVLEGGPTPDVVVEVGSASLLIDGRDHGMPGAVARYRQTRRKDSEGRTIYAFKGWDRIVAQVSALTGEQNG